MRTVAEEEPSAAAPMRHVALQEGALLRHLAAAVAPPSASKDVDGRDISRQLVGLWCTRSSPAMAMLERCFPPGMPLLFSPGKHLENLPGEMPSTTVSAGSFWFPGAMGRPRLPGGGVGGWGGTEHNALIAPYGLFCPPQACWPFWNLLWRSAAWY